MICWQFWVLHTRTGRNVIADWRKKDLVAQQKADMDALILIWKTQKKWDSNDFKMLGGGLSEFRFRSCKAQLRLIGFHWPRSPLGAVGNYTFVLGCSHKQRVYDPPEALTTAADRMENLQRGIGSHHAYS